MKYNNLQAFTLVEILVASTIFSLLLVSVLTVFMLSSSLSSRLELSRNIQENIKIFTEDIAESVRKNDLLIHLNATTGLSDCGDVNSSGDYGHVLCLIDDSGTKFRYFLGIQEADGDFSPRSPGDCLEIDKTSDVVCRIIRDKDGERVPLSSNMVNVEDLRFQVVRENKSVAYVKMVVKIRSSYKAGVRSDLINSTRILLQSSFSERTIITK